MTCTTDTGMSSAHRAVTVEYTEHMPGDERLQYSRCNRCKRGFLLSEEEFGRWRKLEGIIVSLKFARRV